MNAVQRRRLDQVESQGEEQTGELLLQILYRISIATDAASDARFTYLIGDNGTGKSQLLRAVADELLASRNLEEKGPSVACISSSLRDRFAIKDSDDYQYLGMRNAPNASFYAATERLLATCILSAMSHKRNRLVALEESSGLEFSIELVKRRKSRSGRVALGDLVDQRRARRFAVFKKNSRVLTDKLSPFVDQQTPFRRLNRDAMDALRMVLRAGAVAHVRVREPRGPWVMFGSLSSGEQNRLTLFAKVLCAAKEHSVLLIDEPEISLHLHWQSTFHEELAALIAPLERIHVVVATHAPVLVSAAVRSDRNSAGNAVITMTRVKKLGELSEEGSAPMVPVSYTLRCFSEPRSHDEIVLKEFQTLPYRGRELSFEIAEAMLAAAEDERTSAELAEELKAIEASVGDAPASEKKNLRDAIRLLEEGLIPRVFDGHSEDDQADDFDLQKALPQS